MVDQQQPVPVLGRLYRWQHLGIRLLIITREVQHRLHDTARVQQSRGEGGPYHWAFAADEKTGADRNRSGTSMPRQAHPQRVRLAVRPNQLNLTAA